MEIYIAYPWRCLSVMVFQMAGTRLVVQQSVQTNNKETSHFDIKVISQPKGL